MARKANPTKGPNAFKCVLIHPDLHKQISHEAIDGDLQLWERIHLILCKALDREDLASIASVPADSCPA